MYKKSGKVEKRQSTDGTNGKQRADGHSPLTVTVLTVKGLNAAPKSHSVTINKKQDPTVLPGINMDKDRFEIIRECKKIHRVNTNLKKALVAK